MVITDLQTLDLRFPTSRTQAGTDAMHSDPDKGKRDRVMAAMMKMKKLDMKVLQAAYDGK